MLTHVYEHQKRSLVKDEYKATSKQIQEHKDMHWTEWRHTFGEFRHHFGQLFLDKHVHMVVSSGCRYSGAMFAGYHKTITNKQHKR